MHGDSIYTVGTGAAYLRARPFSIATMLMLEAMRLGGDGRRAWPAARLILAAVLAWRMTRQDSLPIDAWAFLVQELWLLAPALLSAALAVLLRGWRAVQANISATLARRG